MDVLRSTRAKRRVALALACAGLATGVAFTVPGVASAHHADITATPACAGGGAFVVNYTATSWQTADQVARANPDVRVSVSVDGGAATEVGAGAFTPENGFTFSGQFGIPAGSTSIEVYTTAVGTWGSGYPGGAMHSTGPIGLPRDCAPPTTTSTTTSTTTTSTTSTTTTTTTTLPPTLDGCTPGYWKNHTDSWVGYSPGQSTSSVFSGASAFPSLGAQTLLQSLQGGGGSGNLGSARILLRAGTAALLNASHGGVDYTMSAADVIAAVDTALGSGSRDAMLALASSLDNDNNIGCPLN